VNKSIFILNILSAGVKLQMIGNKSPDKKDTTKVILEA
jgi:hypothetical protein